MKNLKDLVKMRVKELVSAMDMEKAMNDLAFDNLMDEAEKMEQLMMSLNTMKLVLEEMGPQKRIIMEAVTADEGNMLLMAMGRQKSDRLLLPFQMVDAFYQLGAEVEGAVLYSCENFEKKVKLYVRKADNSEFALDLRLADALVLTLLEKVPFYVKEKLLAVQQLPMESFEGTDLTMSFLRMMPLEDLQQEIERAIRSEHYEYAEAVKKVIDEKKKMNK